MRRFLAGLIVSALLSLAVCAEPVFAQTGCQTTSLPANTVLGRLGAGQSGPCEAIPFANFFAQIPLTSLPSGLTLPSPNFTGTVTGNGTIPNAVLVNSSTTVNGQTCTLGGTCTISASAGTITEGTTLVAGGTNGDVLTNGSGTLTGVGTTGSGGNFVRATGPTISAPTISGHPTIEGVTSTGATGTGAFAFATSPTLVTPVLGVATATSINKVAITQPASSATLTIANGKTLTVSNTITFTGTDSTSFALPGTSDTLAGLGTAQSWTAQQTFARLGVQTRVETANYTINTTGGDYLICVRATAAMTITLPGSPTAGDTYLVKDCAANSNTNNITVSRNGNPIDGVSADALISTNGQSIAFTYIDGTTGWAQN